LKRLPASKTELKPDRRKLMVAVPLWLMWINWFLLCVMIGAVIVYSACQLIFCHDYAVLIFLAFVLPAAYILSTSLIALPVTLTAGSKLLRHEYLELEFSHRRVLRLLKRLPVPKDATFAALYVNMALGQMQRGLSKEAEANLQEALKYVKEAKKQDRPLAAIAYCNLGSANFRQSKIQESIDAYTHALKIIDSMPSFYNSYRLVAYNGLGIAHTRGKDFDEAAEYFQKCLDLCQKDKCRAISKKSMPLVKFAAHGGMALAWIARGNRSAADASYERMLDCVRENPNCGDANSAYVLSELALGYLQAGDSNRCEQILQLTYGWCTRQPMHPESQNVLDAFEKLLQQTGRADEIADMRGWLRLVPATIVETRSGRNAG
jgi:tetratricopeptide (TPR) repeat protein